jgi:hypothetical protein
MKKNNFTPSSLPDSLPSSLFKSAKSYLTSDSTNLSFSFSSPSSSSTFNEYKLSNDNGLKNISCKDDNLYGIDNLLFNIFISNIINKNNICNLNDNSIMINEKRKIIICVISCISELKNIKINGLNSLTNEKVQHYYKNYFKYNDDILSIDEFIDIIEFIHNYQLNINIMDQLYKRFDKSLENKLFWNIKLFNVLCNSKFNGFFNLLLIRKINEKKSYSHFIQHFDDEQLINVDNNKYLCSFEILSHLCINNLKIMNYVLIKVSKYIEKIKLKKIAYEFFASKMFIEMLSNVKPIKYDDYNFINLMHSFL